MKNMNTILLLFVAQIFGMGAVALTLPHPTVAGPLATYVLLIALQIFFSAVILSAVMQYSASYRVAQGLPSVTNEYCPAEIHRMLFLLGIAAFIGGAWFWVKYDFPAPLLPIVVTSGGFAVTIAARFIEREFQRKTSSQLKPHAGHVSGGAAKLARG